MPYSALSDDASTVSQFTRRKEITATTDGTSTPVSYQVKLIITYESEMQVDFDDIRFNTKAGVYIDYWIESHTDSATATVWIKLSDAITDPGSDTIWMYYGNPGLSNGADGNDVFLFFDDFPGLSIDTNKWTVGEGDVTVGSNTLTLSGTDGVRGLIYGKTNISIDAAIHTMVRYAQLDSRNSHFCTLRVSDSSSKADVYCRWNTGLPALVTNDGEAFTLTDCDSIDTPTDWHGYSLTWKSGEVKMYQDDTLKITHTENIPSMDLVASFHEGTIVGGDIDVDWVFARKFITNKPTVSYSSAQHRRRVSCFIG